MKDKLRIAIDGPSGAGKSTIAKGLAAALEIDYIDTGSMYRAVGYKMLRDGVRLDDEEALKKMLADTQIDFSGGQILLDGQSVNDKIRTPEISKMASDCSALGVVREKLVALQREMGQAKSVVMDGRDICNNVLPNAEVKIFLTASLEERARRRWLELREKGTPQDLADVEKDMAARDRNDSTRALNPLRKAEDAMEVDSTDMTEVQVMEFILNKIKQEN